MRNVIIQIFVESLHDKKLIVLIRILYFYMVKMAHAPLPKPICKPINTSKMCPSDFTTTLSDVSLTFTIFIYFITSLHFILLL